MRYRAFCESPGELSGDGNGASTVEADNDGDSMPWETNEYAGLSPSVAYHVWNANRITQHEGSNEPVFNPVSIGLGSYLANVWKATLEKARQLADKRFVYEGRPVYRRVSPKLAIIEDEGFNPEEYGGNWEDYTFMKRWEAGKIIRPIGIDEKILNPTGIGTRPLQDTLYDNVERREREIDRQRKDTDKRLIDNIEMEGAGEGNMMDNIKGGVGDTWEDFMNGVRSGWEAGGMTNYKYPIMIIGGVVLLLLIVK